MKFHLIAFVPKNPGASAFKKVKSEDSLGPLTSTLAKIGNSVLKFVFRSGSGQRLLLYQTYKNEISNENGVCLNFTACGTNEYCLNGVCRSIFI